jgi:hypothetical protein
MLKKSYILSHSSTIMFDINYKNFWKPIEIFPPREAASLAMYFHRTRWENYSTTA